MSAAVSGATEWTHLFSPAYMVLDLRSSTRDQVLFELINRVPGIHRNEVAKQQLHRALLERERLCCTAVGKGIAIPHTRSNIAGIAGRPVVVFGRHQDGIDYCENGSPDIRLFFLLLAPDVNRHLHTLSRLTRLLRDEELRNELLSVSEPEEVLDAINRAESRL